MAKNVDLGIIEEPSPTMETNNLNKSEKGSLVDLNFKVDPEFRKDFRVFASSRDMTQKQVLEKAFALLKRSMI